MSRKHRSVEDLFYDYHRKERVVEYRIFIRNSKSDAEPTGMVNRKDRNEDIGMRSKLSQNGVMSTDVLRVQVAHAGNDFDTLKLKRVLKDANIDVYSLRHKYTLIIRFHSSYSYNVNVFMINHKELLVIIDSPKLLNQHGSILTHISCQECVNLGLLDDSRRSKETLVTHVFQKEVRGKCLSFRWS